MRRFPALVILVVLLACAAGAARADDPPGTAPAPVRVKADLDGDKIFDDLELRLDGLGAADRVDVLVMLRTPPSSALDSLRTRVGHFPVSRQLKVVHAFAASLTKTQVLALAKAPTVVHVEENSRVQAANDSAQASFGALKARLDAGVDGDGDGDPRSYSKDDLVAAVIDSGVDPNHADLDDGKVIGFKDLVGDETAAYDNNDHGTHVAATIAGDGEGDARYTGVAPGAAIVGVKVLDEQGSGYMEDVAAGIDWVVQNKDVYGIEAINLSLADVWCSSGTDVTSLAVNAAVMAGLVVAAAAGNYGPGTCTIGSPGAAASAITVGAMADLGLNGFYLAHFSGRGPTVDGRTKPDIVAPGVGVTSAQAGTTAGYVTWDGTSMATPFVAGVALLMRDINPGVSAQQVKNLLMQTAIDWGRAGNNRTAGSRGPDNDYGAGRLDAYAAIKAAGAAIAGPPIAPAHDLWEGTVNQYSYVDRRVDVTSTSFPIAATMIMASVTNGTSWSPNFDLYLLDPSGNTVASSATTRRQEHIAYRPPITGAYTLRVRAARGQGAFFVDISAPLGVPAADTTPPAISSIDPLDGATGVATSAVVGVTFNEAMDTAATQGAFSLVRASDGAPVGGSFSWTGTTMRFTPSLALDLATDYRATITTAARDLAGNRLTAQRVWTFTTVLSGPTDTTAPTITSIAPADGASGVATSTTVRATFSEAMNTAATQGAFSLARVSDGAAVAGSFSWSGETMTFTPSAALATSTQYRARLTTAATDVAGNALASERVWTFTTAAPPLATVTAAPSATTIQTGTYKSGNASSLAADDTSVYEVTAVVSGWYGVSAWYGSFTGVSNGLSGLKITYKGRNSRSCGQTVDVWRWTDSTWVQLDSRNVDVTEVLVANLAPPGAHADYVSGTSGDGELRVRIRCSALFATFTATGNFLQIEYQRP